MSETNCYWIRKYYPTHEEFVADNKNLIMKEVLLSEAFPKELV